MIVRIRLGGSLARLAPGPMLSVELPPGATVGACSGGSFKPSEALLVACFKGKNVSIAATSAKTDTQKAALKKLGITLGYCKA